jgi:iron complex outermembrane receptor protein
MTRHLLVSSSFLFAALAAAQPVQQVTITGRTLTPLAIGGFGDTPLARSPLSGSQLTEAQLNDAGARSIADLTRLDASANDAYNAEGYWSNLSVRGFTLDNRFNYRRDGLPINAETAIALHNKSALEILKGTSGVQAGTSAPGGLVNFVVKRPDRNLRSATLGWRENGTLGAVVDVSQRFGEHDVFGLRVNAAAERLDPQTRNLKGDRHLLALAGDWRIGTDTLVEAELETGRQSQPSLPGFSLLGGVVPDAHTIDPRTNLNNQPWSLPVVFDGHTGSLRVTRRFGDWRVAAHAMTQRLRTDDRIAFPFGCSAEAAFDRYCSDGSFDLYDYRSENERRRIDALDVSLAGKAALAGVEHQITVGVLRSRFKDRLPDLAFNFAGTGRIDGSVVTPPAPDPIPGSAVARNGSSTELYLRDAVRFDERFSAWFGLRHTRLYRGDEQSFTTPWLALGVAVAPNTLVYASWGQGVESYVTPNLPTYANPGAVLPAQKSRQFELGVKGRVATDVQWSVAGFDIRRPFVSDTGSEFLVDGSQRHRGVEAQLEGRRGGWQWLASVMALQARASDGSRPPNVPARNLKLMLGRDIDALPGLNVQSWLAAEGGRTLLPGATSPQIGGWARLDLAARYTQHVGGTTLTWRAGVDNVADRRAWKESPYQFGHVYLYAMAPRTWRVSLQVDL